MVKQASRRTGPTLLMGAAAVTTAFALAGPAAAAAPDRPAGLEAAVVAESEAPDGTRIQNTTAVTSDLPPAERAHVAGGWIEAYTTAGGVRIRTRPVNGTIVGTIGYGQTMWVSCKRGAGDGYQWGWTTYKAGGRWINGWVRGDLWQVRQHTAPGGGGTPTVPAC